MQVELTVIYQFLNYVRQIIFHIFAFGFIARILNIYGTGLQIDYYTGYEIKIYGVISSVDWLTV